MLASQKQSQKQPQNRPTQALRKTRTMGPTSPVPPTPARPRTKPKAKTRSLPEPRPPKPVPKTPRHRIISPPILSSDTGSQEEEDSRHNAAEMVMVEEEVEEVKEEDEEVEEEDEEGEKEPENFAVEMSYKIYVNKTVK